MNEISSSLLLISLNQSLEENNDSNIYKPKDNTSITTGSNTRAGYLPQPLESSRNENRIEVLSALETTTTIKARESSTSSTSEGNNNN
jgi:hypothetical protein